MNAKKQRVLLIGGTAGTGRELVTQLLERGYTVRVLSRHPQKAFEKLPATVEIAQGDLTEPATLLPAVWEADHIILTAGLPRRFIARGRAKAMLYDGTRALINAAQMAKLPGRFLYMSALGTTKLSVPGVLLNMIKGGTLHWRRHAEREIRRSGLEYSIVHAGILNDEKAGQHTLELSQHNYPLSLRYKISRADVAEVFVRALNHPQTRNATFDAVWAQEARSEDWDALFGQLSSDADRASKRKHHD